MIFLNNWVKRIDNKKMRFIIIINKNTQIKNNLKNINKN